MPSPIPRRSAVLLVTAAAVVSAWSLVIAQQPQFKSGTGVVSLFATVVDAEKHLVPDLTRDDF
jgi:hypothetical protein